MRIAMRGSDMVGPYMTAWLLPGAVGFGRLAYPHLRLDEMDAVGFVAAGKSIQKRSRRKSSDLRLPIPDGGQRRRRDRRFLEVVISRYRNVLAGHEARARDAVHQADGDEIIPANGSGRLLRQRQEVDGRLEPALLRPRSGNAQVGVDLYLRLAQGVDVALISIAPGRRLIRAADHCDRAVAKADQ